MLPRFTFAAKQRAVFYGLGHRRLRCSTLFSRSVTDDETPLKYANKNKNKKTPQKREFSSTTDDSNPLSLFRTMAELVSKDLYEVEIRCDNVDAVTIPAASSLSADRISKLIFRTNSSTVLEALVLPRTVLPVWPHMLERKQRKSLAPFILFRRTDYASCARESKAEQLLREGSSAVWIGLPGIGKTMATMTMLVRLLLKMRDEHRRSSLRVLESESQQVPDPTSLVQADNKLNKVYYRLRTKLFVFTWDATQQAICVEEKEWNKGIQENFTSPKKNEVMVVEMGEDERDPVETALFSSSCRKIFEETFKSHKKGHTDFFLVEPPSAAVLKLMYATISALHDELLHAHIDDAAKFNALLDDVGPLPRYLFAPEDDLNTYLRQRQSAAEDPFDNMKLVSISHTDTNLKYFMAPYLKPGDVMPRIGSKYSINLNQDELRDLTVEERERLLGENDDVYEFRALSQGSKLLLASKVRTNDHLKILRRIGKEHELLEAVVMYAGALDTGVRGSLLPHDVEPRMRLDQWKWFTDPGPVPLASSMQMSEEEVQRLLPRRCTRTVLVSGSRVQIPVWKMEEGSLYVPDSKSNLAVIEWLFVDHKERRVYGHQVTMSTFVNHAFRTENLDAILNDLHMFEPKGLEYKLVILGVNDLSVERPTGMRFFETEEKANNNNNNSQSSSQSSSQSTTTDKRKAVERFPANWKHQDRLETYIARMSCFSLPEHLLPDPPSKKTPSKKTPSKKAPSKKTLTKRRSQKEDEDTA